MSRNAIKYLAMAAMFCNHFAYIFLKEGSTGQEVMVDIGYFTAITMCYFLVEGYHYTGDDTLYCHLVNSEMQVK